MAKNTRWPADALKKKGYVQNEKGDYVKVESLVAKGKVEKIESFGSSLLNGTIKFGLPTAVVESIEGKNFKTVNIPYAEYYGLPDGDLVIIKHRFDIAPKPAPRMSRSDQWKTVPYHPDPKKCQRPVITRYFAWRDAFRAMSAEKGFTLGEKLRVVFIFPVPAYLSKAKRAARMGQYHRQKPDYDNCCKSIGDAFHIDDGHICDVRAVKMWGEKPEIIIF